MFRVGQKVVCVDDTLYELPRHDGGPLVQRGVIYTVRWLGEFPFAPDRKHGLAVKVCEIVRPSRPARPEYSDYPWRANRFRPVVERKTDISIFTAMLNSKKSRVRV